MVVTVVVAGLVVHLSAGPTLTMQSSSQLSLPPEGRGVGDGRLDGVPHPGVGLSHHGRLLLLQGRPEGDGVDEEAGREGGDQHPAPPLSSTTGGHCGHVLMDLQQGNNFDIYRCENISSSGKWLGSGRFMSIIVEIENVYRKNVITLRSSNSVSNYS